MALKYVSGKPMDGARGRALAEELVRNAGTSCPCCEARLIVQIHRPAFEHLGFSLEDLAKLSTPGLMTLATIEDVEESIREGFGSFAAEE